MGRDQGDVAARVVRLGAGIKISKKASLRVFRSAITRILNDSGYRDAAKTISAIMTQKNEQTRAIAELEALLRESKAENIK